jgi:hypothetical protein
MCQPNLPKSVRSLSVTMGEALAESRLPAKSQDETVRQDAVDSDFTDQPVDHLRVASCAQE